VAKYFVSFLEGESCGKCLPCREGLQQMRDILTRIAEGKGKKGDITLLKELAELLQDAALCALGSQASNPVLSTLKHFHKEYEAHINRKQCPAGVCKIGPAKVK
jgi:NADH-quinone oxidoreductase subunit F